LAFSEAEDHYDVPGYSYVMGIYQTLRYGAASWHCGVFCDLYHASYGVF